MVPYEKNEHEQNFAKSCVRLLNGMHIFIFLTIVIRMAKSGPN
jgi:hypothetical protein